MNRFLLIFSILVISLILFSGCTQQTDAGASDTEAESSESDQEEMDGEDEDLHEADEPEDECVTEQDCIDAELCSAGMECTCLENTCYAGYAAPSGGGETEGDELEDAPSDGTDYALPADEGIREEREAAADELREEAGVEEGPLVCADVLQEIEENGSADVRIRIRVSEDPTTVTDEIQAELTDEELLEIQIFGDGGPVFRAVITQGGLDKLKVNDKLVEIVASSAVSHG